MADNKPANVADGYGNRMQVDENGILVQAAPGENINLVTSEGGEAFLNGTSLGSGGGGTPGGTPGELQFNNAGEFGGVIGSSVDESSVTLETLILLDNLDLSETNGNFILGPGMPIISANGVSFTDANGNAGLPGQVLTPGQFGGGMIWGEQAGQVDLESPATSVSVPFSSFQTSKPVVIVTPTSNPVAFYWITYEGSAGAWTGFTINVSATSGSNVIFNYKVGFNVAE
jgi:hypothetical protein